MSLLSGTDKIQVIVNADKDLLDFFNHEAYLNSTLNKKELLEQLQNQQPIAQNIQQEEVFQEVYSEEELNFFFQSGTSNKKASAIYLKSEEFLKEDKIETENKYKKAEEKPLTTSDKLNMIFGN